MICTSNKGFVEWASVFGGDEVLAAAILDCVLHHCTVVNIRGQSYWLKEKLKGGQLENGEPTDQRISRRQKQPSD
jgi:DNA replication protein DnaC